MGPERVARMNPGPLNEPELGVVWRVAVDQRHAAGEPGPCQVSEFLGIPAGEIGVVVGLDFFPYCQRPTRPVRKIAPVLVPSLIRVRLEVHARTPAMIELRFRSTW